jgi:hypothetical protein
VGEDLPDRRPLQDRRDDLELPAAKARAAPQVDVEHALEQPRPRYRNGLMSVGLSRSSRDSSSQSSYGVLLLGRTSYSARLVGSMTSVER